MENMEKKNVEKNASAEENGLADLFGDDRTRQLRLLEILGKDYVSFCLVNLKKQNCCNLI